VIVWEWELLGSVAALLTMFGFVPQILKIYRTRSVADISIVMLLQFFSGVFLWLLYGLHIQNNIIIAANAISLVTLITAIGLYVKYRNNK